MAEPLRDPVDTGKNSGDGEIRTPDTLLRYTHFPGVLLQPLGHISIRKKLRLVPPERLELSHLTANDPKSLMSTNSNKGA